MATAQAGFTLIELMVAITLLGLLLALGLPALTGAIRNSQVRSVAEALQNGVRTAQAEAVRRNRQVVMAFTNANPSPPSAAPWTVAANGKNWWMQTVPQFGETAEFIRSGTVAEAGSNVIVTVPTAICFNSSGRLATNNAAGTGVPGASCSAAAAALGASQANSREVRVTVQIGGQLRICDPNRTLSDTTPDGC